MIAAALSLTLAVSMVRPSLLFSDNMVLLSSASEPATVFGRASPGETVRLSDSRPGTTDSHATASEGGKWVIRLAPHVRAKGEQSFELELSGSEVGPRLVARNVAYGEVLLCSGQSNMAITLMEAYNATEIIAASDRPEIRLFSVVKQGSSAPLSALLNDSAPGNPFPAWRPSDPALTPYFSAICYLTALELQRLHHPDDPDAVYGIIDSAVGSTDVQSWMSVESRDTALHSCWTPANATVLPPSHSHAPSGATNASELWNAMIGPLVPFGLSAVLWDQGENDAQYCTAPEYSCLFSSMIGHWRSVFGQPTLPVAWAQIGGYTMDAYDQGGAALNSVIRFGQGDSLPADTDQVFDSVQSNLEGTVTPLPAFITVSIANGGGSERSLEYNTMSDRYARFVIDEVLPSVLTRPDILDAYPNLKLTSDSAGRAAMGCSAGGIAAITMAFFSDEFTRVAAYSPAAVDLQVPKQPEKIAYPMGAREWMSHDG